MAKAKWLEYYAHYFNTVELNSSFYRLPSETAFASWHDSSPASFLFSVKVSRFITHIKRLKDTEDAVAKFMARAKILGGKLGPLLYQLPPSMHCDEERLDGFLSTLPQEAQHVFEFRHESWLQDKTTFEILNKHKAGFCVFDMPSLSCPLVATADFAYIRFHGSTGLYSSCYSDDEMYSWAQRLTDLAGDLKAIYIYFNNDVEGFAVRNAMTLRDYLVARKGVL